MVSHITLWGYVVSYYIIDQEIRCYPRMFTFSKIQFSFVLHIPSQSFFRDLMIFTRYE